jgi:hypothetical protein
MKKKKIEIEKEIVFISCSFVCVFVNSSIENLFAFVFSVSEMNLSIFCVESSAFLNAKKCKIVQRNTKFFEKFIIIDDDVTSFYATCDLNFSSQNKNNRMIEEKKKETCISSEVNEILC